jgi:hypothetical protein
MKPKKRSSILAFASALLMLPILGCREEGPAEKAGRKVDETIDKLRHPNEGPLEKAGRKADEAADDLRN